MIELIVYTKPKNDNRFYNFSPFCAKTEIFLKLAGIDHKVVEFSDNPGKFPKAKLPVIKDNGELICDSWFIEEHLKKKFDVDMDSHLSASERAQGFAFSKMLDEFFYWAILCERWAVDKNWARIRDDYFGHIPRFIRGPITSMIRSGTIKSTKGHGMGRHSEEEVHQLGVECIKALSDFLGEKDFLLGDKISSYDVTSYAFASNALFCDLGPRLQKECEKYPNLAKYCERMSELVNQKKH